METGLAFFPSPGFGIPQFFEYLLVVHPGNGVYEKVLEETERFSADYKVSAVKRTLPQIIVANFLAKEGMEETIIKWMQRIISEHECFNVLLNNYSGLPSHTVFARVQYQEPFKQLANSLKVIDHYITSNGCPSAKLISCPHLTIAGKLQPNIYEKAIFDYSRKTFHAAFTVNELILLKRQNQFDECRQVSVFRLSGSRSESLN